MEVRTTCHNQFFPSTLWILVIEPRPFSVGGKCLNPLGCLITGPRPSSYRLLTYLSLLFASMDHGSLC